MDHWRIWLRSVQGQLSLLAGVFVCAVVLAVVLILLRERLFEAYVREVYPPLDGWSEGAARTLARPDTGKGEIDKLGEEIGERMGKAEPGHAHDDLERVYGAWVGDDALDPAGVLPGRLTGLQPGWVVERLRRTLVAGRPGQRERALVWMRLVAGEPEVRDAIRELALFARRQAGRRGEGERRQQADAVLATGRSGAGVR